MAYFSLFSVVLFFSYFVRTRDKLGIRRSFKNYEVLAFFIFVLIFTLFYGLRYNVGIDYMSYYNNAALNLWNKPQHGTKELFEPCFRALYAIGSFFELPANTVFLLGGFLIYFFLFLGIKNYSDSVLLSLFIFAGTGLYFFSFNEFRQFIAVCIVFWGYKFPAEKKFIKWILLVFFAMLFHKSAFIVFPMYFLAKFKFSKLTVNIVLIATLILKKIGIFDLLCTVLSYMPGHYSEYAETLTWMSKSGGSGIVGYLYLFMLFAANNSKFRTVFFEERKMRTFSNILLFGAVFVNIFADIYMVVRLMEYFLISVVIFFPAFSKISRKNKYLYFFSFLLIGIYSANIIKYSFFSAPENLLNYQTVFSK